MLAPFSKKLLQLTLRGITTDDHDLSVCSPHPTSLGVSFFFFFADENVVLGGLDPHGDVASFAAFRDRRWLGITSAIFRH